MIRFVAALILGLVTGLVITVPAPVQRQHLSMDPGWRFVLGRPRGRRAAGIRRPRLAPRGPAARLEHRGTMKSGAAGGGRMGFLPGGSRLVPQGIPDAGRIAWPTRSLNSTAST